MSVSLPPFQRLIDAHGRDVYRFLVAMVGREDADDCYQETWLSALRAYPSLRDSRNLRGWIFTVAHRKAMDEARRRRRAPVASLVLPEPALADDGPEARGGGPLGDDLWGRVRQLPSKQRTAVGLRFLADAGYPEIAALIGCSEEAARRSVHEGLKRLRTELIG